MHYIFNLVISSPVICNFLLLSVYEKFFNSTNLNVISEVTNCLHQKCGFTWVGKFYRKSNMGRLCLCFMTYNHCTCKQLHTTEAMMDNGWAWAKKKTKNALCGTKRHDCIVNGCGKHHRSLRKSNLAFLKHFQQPRQNDLLYFTLGQKKKSLWIFKEIFKFRKPRCL